MNNKRELSRKNDEKKPDEPAAWQIITIVIFLFYMLVPILSTYLFSIATSPLGSLDPA